MAQQTARAPMDQLQKVSGDELAFAALKELIVSTNKAAIWTEKQDVLAQNFIRIVRKSSGKQPDGDGGQE